ncbi:MAG: type II toxin-antitoxin system VapC family toxin [Pseudomonadota bacterium]
MRRLLLDTHALLWWLMDAPALGARARGLIEDGRNEVFVSAATTWEIAIKMQLGKIEAPEGLNGVVEEEGFRPLSISLFHGTSAGLLVWEHRDPFDRMLVAQAQAEGLEVVTADARILGFGIRTVDASK